MTQQSILHLVINWEVFTIIYITITIVTSHKPVGLVTHKNAKMYIYTVSEKKRQ